MKKYTRINISFLGVLFCVVALSQSAWALSCGTFDYPKCDGSDLQYAGNFKPQVGFGGFGGGNCVAGRTPVIFIHGNGDRATNWDSPITGSVKKHTAPKYSVYQEFKAQGYNDCELFGVTYLSAEEQLSPENNYHQPEKYDMLIAFIEAVKSYTGRQQVDIVAHSLGASMSIAALTYQDNINLGENGWKSVRKFVNIAGGLRGLPSCLSAGFSNPFIATCGSENIFNKYIFGFYPNSQFAMGFNRWTGDKGRFSLRRAPGYHPKVTFYTLHTGVHDQIHCTTLQGYKGCDKGALFSQHTNVRAQLNVGVGSKAPKLDFDFTKWRPNALTGGDADGVGHFKSRNNTGQIIFEMLNTDCTGLACKGAYTGGPVKQ